MIDVILGTVSVKEIWKCQKLITNNVLQTQNDIPLVTFVGRTFPKCSKTKPQRCIYFVLESFSLTLCVFSHSKKSAPFQKIPCHKLWGNGPISNINKQLNDFISLVFLYIFLFFPFCFLRVFLMFSRDIERDQWYKIGLEKFWYSTSVNFSLYHYSKMYVKASFAWCIDQFNSF